MFLTLLCKNTVFTFCMFFVHFQNNSFTGLRFHFLDTSTRHKRKVGAAGKRNVLSRRIGGENRVQQQVEGVVGRVVWRPTLTCGTFVNSCYAEIQTGANLYSRRGGRCVGHVAYAKYWADDKETLQRKPGKYSC